MATVRGAVRGTQPVLTGAQVRLRPWTPDDADAVFAACQDAEIQRWTTVPSPYSYDDAVGYVTTFAPQAWQQGDAVFAIVDTATGSPVGSIGAHGVRGGTAEIGYWVAAAARGRGLARDALRTLARWCLREVGVARLELMVDPTNLGSRRVAEVAGFTAEGTLRRRLVVQGRRIDVVMYSLLPDDPAATAL
ncbi:GNAT family N-acetyltransferase [Pseudonocardia sp. RS11V-5]|uniref:GNAT family N-acetyltransferase n=1 Tax=Pseudonocardia terrae TaxID=2905831 RepID=UPI001E541CBE|nr:GNAT family protein [Pseudonocardia terrae]MCE3551058.1 GNAT family N-acetyltransferase [Pseudonocardia terrae]